MFLPITRSVSTYSSAIPTSMLKENIVCFPLTDEEAELKEIEDPKITKYRKLIYRTDRRGQVMDYGLEAVYQDYVYDRSYQPLYVVHMAVACTTALIQLSSASVTIIMWLVRI